jgi:hypothetical protein
VLPASEVAHHSAIPGLGHRGHSGPSPRSAISPPHLGQVVSASVSLAASAGDGIRSAGPRSSTIGRNRFLICDRFLVVIKPPRPSVSSRPNQPGAEYPQEEHGDCGQQFLPALRTLVRIAPPSGFYGPPSRRSGVSRL